ncbi:hypothetical protein BGW38_005089, partial [Lunasporangiospora selenospora]
SVDRLSCPSPSCPAQKHTESRIFQPLTPQGISRHLHPARNLPLGLTLAFGLDHRLSQPAGPAAAHVCTTSIAYARTLTKRLYLALFFPLCPRSLFTPSCFAAQAAQTDAPQAFPFLPYHPIRVYKVVSTYAELQFNKLMRLVPLFGHFARFQLTNSKKTDVVKNVGYGSRGKSLDIYIGSPTTATASSNSEAHGSDDDAESDHTVESNGSPVIVYVYGGSWDSGHKSMLMPMAQNLASQGYVVVVPDYTLYPKAKIEDMVRDVQDAVVWTTQNATRYGGDPGNIYLMGSGSGAHVASLAIMHDAVQQLGGIPGPSVESDTTPVIELPSWPDTPVTHLGSGKSGLLKERVHGLILFSGVFDITFYYAYLHKRGIEEVSAMPRVMHQSPNNYLACSPSWILANATTSLAMPELLGQVLPKSILIIHGDNDRLVPSHSSQTLFDLLCAAEIQNIKFKLYTGQSHLDPAIDLILPSNAITAALLSDIADVVRPNNGHGDTGSGTGSSTPNGLLDEEELLKVLRQQPQSHQQHLDLHSKNLTASLLRRNPNTAVSC